MASGTEVGDNLEMDGAPETRLVRLSAKELWHNSAPAALRSAWKRDPLGEAWELWRDHLSSRKASDSSPSNSSDGVDPLSWGFSQRALDLETWLQSLTRSAKSRVSDGQLRQQVEDWIGAPIGSVPTLDEALKCAALAHRTPMLAAVLDQEVWWRLVGRLANLAEESDTLTLSADVTAEELLIQQLLAGETPLALAHHLPELRPLRHLRKLASEALSEAVLRLTDGEGVPPAAQLSGALHLFACWTRCLAMGQDMKKGCWSSDAQLQYEWMVRQLVRLARPNGSLMLTPDAELMGADALYKTALQLAGDESDYAAAVTRLGALKVRNGGKPDRDFLPDAPLNSEWSGVSVLATGWAPRSPRIAVSYADRRMKLEFWSAAGRLFAGAWPIDVAVDGVVLRPDADWEEQCWFSDETCDYLEVAIELTEGVRLERQFMIAHADRCAYAAELVLTGRDAPAMIEVKTRLPLASDATFSGEEETRDGLLLVGDRPAVGVTPLALPEWRVERRGGELREEERELVLSHTQGGRNLANPIWFDLAPRRFAKQHTWRQLTVAQALEQTPRDVAVGYRVQSGLDQWLIYRSLDPPANRTVLGQNLASEGMIGRFQRTGTIDQFFEINAED